MSSVLLYIYDLSQGLAKSLSPVLLGRQIDGVWHTSVVVFNREYFFGSLGIESCLPGGTVLREPNQKLDMGNTLLPKSVFEQYLSEMSSTSFRGEKYDLLKHNCNNFSDELTHFLVGKHIPSNITGLPADILQTPFGKMIQPWVESMHVSPEIQSQRPERVRRDMDGRSE